MAKTEAVRVRLTPEDKAALEAVCKSEGVGVSTLIRQVVRELTIPNEQGEWL